MDGAEKSKIINQYQLHLQVEKLMSPGTVLIYINAAQTFLEYCILNYEKLALPNTWNIKELGKRELEYFLQHQIEMEQWQHSTVVTNLSGIRSFYDFMYETKYIANDPFKNFTLPRKLTELKTINIRIDQIKLLFKNTIPTTFLGIQEQLMLEFSYGLGLSILQIINITDTETDKEKQTLKLKFSNKTTNEYPLSLNAVEIIDNYMNRLNDINAKTKFWVNQNSKPLSENQLQKILANYLLKNDLPALSAQELKDLSSLHFSKEGADMRSIQSLRGSKSLRRLQSLKSKNFNHLQEMFKKSHIRNNDA